MGKPHQQSRGLVAFLIVAFCSFLIQPQIGIIAHTHARDEAHHTHSRLSFSPPTSPKRPLAHTHHAHSHTFTHHHAHGAHTHHTHDHVYTPRAQHKQTARTSWRTASSARLHWHALTIAHLPGMIAVFVWDTASGHTTQASPRQLRFSSLSRTTYRSRAPPYMHTI